jgi:hypothetical protein
MRGYTRSVYRTELRKDLDGVQAERAAIHDALEWVRAHINPGRHPGAGKRRVGSGIDIESEDLFRDLLADRRRLNAHADHLRREAADLRRRLKAA